MWDLRLLWVYNPCIFDQEGTELLARLSHDDALIPLQICVCQQKSTVDDSDGIDVRFGASGGVGTRCWNASWKGNFPSELHERDED